MCQSSGGISTDTAGGGGTGSIVVSKRRGGAFQGIRVQNPFTFKVGQVFTGFGVGCGVGIGVGRPINMGAIPVVNQVMSATRGATDAFSGVTRHVNDALRKIGAKNIEAGIGCGVGFGHGFGVGLALKPGIMNQIQSSLILVMTKMMSKFGMGPNFPIGPGALPGSLQSGMSMMTGPLGQSPMGNVMQLGTNSQDNTSQMLTGHGSSGSSFYQSFASSSSPDLFVGSRTEKVIGNFLQNPVLRKGDDTELYNLVLKHQRIIEELQEENEKLRRILIEDLKVSPSKIEDSHSSSSYRLKPPCADCFECRRKQRRK